jgi:hypothetical protein
MKQTFIYLLLVIIPVSSLLAQTPTVSRAVTSSKAAVLPEEVILLRELTYDFGKIPQGRPVTHSFELVNRSKSPLLLENVQASCGCTTPEWSQAPIAAGTASVIKVGFNAASEGRFTKVITITYHNGQVKTFTISGDVYPMPTTSAPLNTSLSLIQ